MGKLPSLTLKVNYTSYRNVVTIIGLGGRGVCLWCLPPLSTIFQLYLAVSFIGEGNWRNPPTSCKSLTNLIRNPPTCCKSLDKLDQIHMSNISQQEIVDHPFRDYFCYFYLKINVLFADQRHSIITITISKQNNNIHI